MENISPEIIYHLHSVALAIDEYWYNSVQFKLAHLLSPGLGLAQFDNCGRVTFFRILHVFRQRS